MNPLSLIFAFIKEKDGWTRLVIAVVFFAMFWIWAGKKWNVVEMAVKNTESHAIILLDHEKRISIVEDRTKGRR